MPDVMVREGGAFESYLDHCRINVLIKKPPQGSPARSITWGHNKKQSATQKRARTRTQPCWHHDLRLPASRTTKKIFLPFVSHSVCGILLYSLNGLRPEDSGFSETSRTFTTVWNRRLTGGCQLIHVCFINSPTHGRMWSEYPFHISQKSCCGPLASPHPPHTSLASTAKKVLGAGVWPDWLRSGCKGNEKAFDHDSQWSSQNPASLLELGPLSIYTSAVTLLGDVRVFLFVCFLNIWLSSQDWSIS